MTSGIDQSLTEKLVKWAACKPEILNLYLFGSRVRGNNSQESDLDCAVEFDEDALGHFYSNPLAAYWHLKKPWSEELMELIPHIVQHCRT